MMDIIPGSIIFAGNVFAIIMSSPEENEFLCTKVEFNPDYMHRAFLDISDESYFSSINEGKKIFSLCVKRKIKKDNIEKTFGVINETTLEKINIICDMELHSRNYEKQNG
ncbi:MAG: hypothetical protein SOH81_11705 [Acetobacter sp.]|jgi:hypothetical protein